MAKKIYRLKHDSSFPKVLSKLSKEGDDNDVYATEGRNYPAGSFIKEEDMHPRDAKRAENGELDHLLELTSEEDYQAAGGDRLNSDYGLFIPEHENEAHILSEYGHAVVNDQQKTELMTGGIHHAAGYGAQVKEAGYDRRPKNEAAVAAREERIPEEFLVGGETPTGLPHERGYPGQRLDAEHEARENAQRESENTEGDAEQDATRPRPPGSEASQENTETRQEGQGEGQQQQS